MKLDRCILDTNVTKNEKNFLKKLELQMRYRAASCKKSTRKNKLIRKNKSTRTEIFRYKISVLVDLFFLINLFFLIDFLHENKKNMKILDYINVSMTNLVSLFRFIARINNISFAL